MFGSKPNQPLLPNPGPDIAQARGLSDTYRGITGVAQAAVDTRNVALEQVEQLARIEALLERLVAAAERPA